MRIRKAFGELASLPVVGMRMELKQKAYLGVNLLYIEKKSTVIPTLMCHEQIHSVYFLNPEINLYVWSFSTNL